MQCEKAVSGNRNSNGMQFKRVFYILVCQVSMTSWIYSNFLDLNLNLVPAIVVLGFFPGRVRCVRLKHSQIM